MHSDEFAFDLPPRLIAQQPATERDLSRLLVVRRGGPVLSHRVFRDLPELLEPGDLLVLNDTHVLAPRLIGRRSRSGGKGEGLYLRTTPEGGWELLSQTRGRLIVGEVVLAEGQCAKTVDLSR